MNLDKIERNLLDKYVEQVFKEEGLEEKDDSSSMQSKTLRQEWFEKNYEQIG